MRFSFVSDLFTSSELDVAPARDAFSDGIPVLGRGKHRSAKKGACFMEYASFLAGERFSDRPSCTHPSLAALARLVNDWTDDADRTALAPLVPSVIGLVRSDAGVELALAVRAASAALPVASEERQRLLALGLVRALERLDEMAPERSAALRPAARRALDSAPLAERWARRHLDVVRPPRTRNDAPMCDAIVAIAVAGLGQACIDDAGPRMRALLVDAIAEFAAIAGPVVPVGAGAGAGLGVDGSAENRVADIRVPA